jgi:hypothetical protein
MDTFTYAALASEWCQTVPSPGDQKAAASNPLPWSTS